MALMGMETASSSFPSSTTERWKYDVFLSFRDEDTRNNFMDHLFTALTEKGINTFKDDVKLEIGKSLTRAVESNRRIKICYCHSLKRLRISYLVLR